MKIDIRGAITSSMTDNEVFATWIRKGLITPESRFREQVEAAPPDEPLDVYVNSGGGSVFSGWEMSKAVNEWKKRTGQRVTITIGSVAASAAAVFLMDTDADDVFVHSNSIVMFHGAAPGEGVEKGVDGLRDEASKLELINKHIINQLVERYKFDEETVLSWMREGRAGYLDAGTLLLHGIATKVVDGEAKRLVFSKEDYNMFGEGELNVAAFIDDPKLVDLEDQEQEETKEDTDMETDGNIKYPETSDTGIIEVTWEAVEGADTYALERSADQGVTWVSIDTVASTSFEDEVTDGAYRYRVGVFTDEGETQWVTGEHDCLVLIAEQEVPEEPETPEAPGTPEDKNSIEALNIAELSGMLETEQATNAQLNLSIKQLESKLESLNKALDKKQALLDHQKKISDRLEARLSRVAPGRSPSENGGMGVMAWSQALASCGNDYATARTKYPDAYKAFMEKNRR